ncbi:MAG: S-layer homology domain-containing protein [Phormidesmis sp.]
MTQSPIEPPNDPQGSTPPSTGPNRPLSFDEMVAVGIAFLSIGSVLFWGLTRGGIELGQSLVGSDTPLIAPRAQLSPESAEEIDEEIAAADGIANAANEVDELPRSARRRLAARATARRETLARRRDRGIFGTAAAGTAAGVTGAAATEGLAADEVIPNAKEPQTAATATGVTPSAAVTGGLQDPINFNDVPDNYWAKPHIDALSSRGLTAGFEDGLFRPDQPVTRAQIANIVAKAFDLVENKETLAFSDVGNDYWARGPIEEVVKGGFMTGFPDNTFAPDAPVTRAQALTTLVSGLGLEAPANVQASLDRYADANSIPNWANEKMAAATAGNLVINYPNIDRLNPNQPTTRAELSALVYQALVQAGAVEPIDSQYLVKP